MTSPFRPLPEEETVLSENVSDDDGGPAARPEATPGGAGLGVAGPEDGRLDERDG